MDSPHKRPLILRLGVFFVVNLNKFLKHQSSCWCLKTSSCVISYIFSLKFKIHPQILKFLRENSKISKRNKPRLQSDKLFATMVRFIIKFAGNVFSINVCATICYNGWVGRILWYSFRRHISHAIRLGFALGPWLFSIMASDWLVGDRFTAVRVFHHHANTDGPVERKWFITQITTMLIIRWHK